MSKIICFFTWIVDYWIINIFLSDGYSFDSTLSKSSTLLVNILYAIGSLSVFHTSKSKEHDEEITEKQRSYVYFISRLVFYYYGFN